MQDVNILHQLLLCCSELIFVLIPKTLPQDLPLESNNLVNDIQLLARNVGTAIIIVNLPFRMSDQTFTIVEFQDNSIEIINTAWLTPRKHRTFWPPTKDQKNFQKILRNPDPDVTNWHMYEIVRTLYESSKLLMIIINIVY